MKRAQLAVLAVAVVCLAAASCGRPGPETPAAPTTRDPKPVTGRTSTGAGISVDFPQGWAEVPLHGPFTKSYESREAQLHFDVSDFDQSGDSLAVLGQRMHQSLVKEGTVVESGPVTLDGREAYRLLLEKKTENGHGLVEGLVIPRPSGRVTTVFLSTRSGETGRQRELMAELVATIKVEP